MLSVHAFQYSNCITVYRDASRRAILGLVQPRGPAFQVNAVPFQAGDLAGAATGSESKADQGG
jgi:hypothetical protein